MATGVCAESELELGEAIKVIVDGVAVAVVKDSAGNCFALDDMCSHADISLSDRGGRRRGVLGARRFELSTGRARPLPASEPVPVYPLTIIDGDVYVDVSRQVDVAAYVAST